MSAEYLGLKAVGWRQMVNTWWDWVLLILLILSVISGSGYVAFGLYRFVQKRKIAKQSITNILPPEVAQGIKLLSEQTQRLSSKKSSADEPKSFGVYLGKFSYPSTANQLRLLSEWDLIVVDPFRPGVLDAVTNQCTSNHILGRLDIDSLIRGEIEDGEVNTIEAFRELTEILTTRFARWGLSTPFTGVLLAEWKTCFSPVVLNEFIKFIIELGLDVYLETRAPDYLTESESRELNMELFKGMICRNGSILEDGDRRNTYQMTNIKPVLRVVAAQACIRNITLMMWETIEDDVVLSLAVARRSFIWYKYFSAINWIGPRSALVDADVAFASTLKDEPLGALMWLKNDYIIDTQDTWRLNERISRNPSNNADMYDTLHDFVPHLAAKLALTPCERNKPQKQVVLVDDFDFTQQGQPRSNPFDYSARGNEYTGLGCFPVGIECVTKDFASLAEEQRHLRSLGLLDAIKPEQLKLLSTEYQALLEYYNSLEGTPEEAYGLEELVNLINSVSGEEETDDLRVFLGLDSGFKTGVNTQFWGLYDVDPGSGSMDIFISAKAKDLAGTLLHTFMSSRGYTRSQCLIAELALSEQTSRLDEHWQLPPRICQDLEVLTPAENLLLSQRLIESSQAEYPVLSARVRSACEYQLVEVPTLYQLKDMNSAQYLRNKITIENLIAARIEWYRDQECHYPNPARAVSLFREIDARIYKMLINREADVLGRLETALQGVLRGGKIDAAADIFALAVFCAFRKLALDEAYLEVMDRNPLPNSHPDQAACFAEMFSMGSRCEWYLGVTPNVLGEIIQERYLPYYRKVPPPPRDDNATEIPSAYSSSQIDLDPYYKTPKLPFYYQVTFLAIFAVPALIDILSLTTIGRGLYLTTYMSSDEKSMSTIALMISLFLTGAIGTWISNGGSYYLYSMAFPAMNMFVLSRFIAGIAICFIGGILALLLIGALKSFYAGFIFFIYFFFLTTYLVSLATLAIYQLPDFIFQSGRMVIIKCIPILLISPIVTLWVHNHDIIIYPCVMYLFLFCLMIGARRVISQWGTWYHKIPTVTDKEVAVWYMQHAGITAEELAALGASPLPRKLLQKAVDEERTGTKWKTLTSWRPGGTKVTTDDLVVKLAAGFEATMILMDWYCKYSRTNMPYPYSPTWNLQSKAALDTLRDMQKGLKLHNAFIHWRHAGGEVWCGVLYFILALLDKWVAILTGASIVGLSAANSEEFRLSVGFGLAYYLVGAVALDSVALPLWAAANKKAPRPITDLKSLEQVEIDDARAKRRLYWKSLGSFVLLHIWGIAFTSALMWAFSTSPKPVIMYFAYITAYSGLLWYQFNRIFTGPSALKDLIVGIVIAFPLGILLHHFFPTFTYSSVISLGTGTWIVGVLSLFTSNIGTPKFRHKNGKSVLPRPPIFHAHGFLGHRSGLSQATLAEIFNSIDGLPTELHYRLDPVNHPGLEVMDNLLSRSKLQNSSYVRDAFKSAEPMVRRIADFWESGSTVVDLVPTRHLIRSEQKLRSISKTMGTNLHIFVFVGLDLLGDEWVMDIRRNCQVIAEAIISATAEAKLGFTSDHATLAELLAGSSEGEKNFLGSEFLPEGVKRQLEGSETERIRVLCAADLQKLKYLLLGLNCDTDWDKLPRSLRLYLMRRCSGQQGHLTHGDLRYIFKRFSNGNKAFGVEEYISRCNLGYCLAYHVNAYAESFETDLAHCDLPEPPDSSYENCLDYPLSANPRDSEMNLMEFLMRPVVRTYRTIAICVKFIICALVADPEYQRELDYMISSKPSFIRWPVSYLLNGLWNFCKQLQNIILPFFLFHGREKVRKLHVEMKGMRTQIHKRKIVIESLNGPATCFCTSQPDGNFTVQQYSGNYDTQPSKMDKLVAINTYSPKLVLLRREEYGNNQPMNVFLYDYPTDSKLKGLRSRLPSQRHCIKGNLQGQIIHYDERGYITSGSAIKDDNLVEFQFWYRKHAKFDDELIRAEFVLPHIKVLVWWSVPPIEKADKADRWIPHSKVTEATFIQGDDVYRNKWHYDHKFHPIISTTLNGEIIETPAMIQHDWFDVLKKPKNCSFINDNPLFLFDSAKPSFISRLMRLNIQWYPVSTGRARTHLWKSWKDGKELDAVTARWLDEISLRSDKLLKPYWKARDWGRFKKAEEYINAKTDTIMARIDLDPEISAWSALAFKLSDFRTFGMGGDSRINTRSIETQIDDTDTNLHILAMDTGTWPYEGGGVSACRRDMVNNLSTVKWHILAEMANDFGYPKFQIEKNVQSLTILPLWGLDFLTPTHGIYQNCLDSEVERKSDDTSDKDIKNNFIPILTTLVRCSRAIKLEHHHLDEAAKALVELNKYFQSSRHWSDVWKSDIVKTAWEELWLSEDVTNARPPSDWLEAERPTLLHMENALDMWHRYLFIFSVPVPDKIPDVFQASHHFTGASYGVLCKLLRQCTLHVWDHCISWREVTVFLSSAMSFDSPFVCSSLIQLSRLASVLILHHADVILPCADFFNPSWEIELGTQQGTMMHRRMFNRKIDPVVNGITNMERFKPIENIKTKIPTITMLSHIRFVKDIKNAIMAADIIINDWGFTDYQLDIYGDMEKAPSYSVECQEIIASKGLRDHVALKGLGNPTKVLEDTWIFMNSSVSEGLPLALGESALMGVPLICTDVGASFRVVVDINGNRIGKLLAPNDSMSLARAQISMLGLLDEWSAHADDPEGFSPKLSLRPTPEEVKTITERMYEKQAYRRKLGMLSRQNILDSFSGDRYLREHEQMLWIGKHRSPSYRMTLEDPSLASNSSWTEDEWRKSFHQ